MPPTDALTEREKETLRLMMRGHDAKSCARHLGLSVHTINERLREARRKLGVSSSREAARLLDDRERTDPQISGDRRLGEDAAPTAIAASDTTKRRQLLTLVGGGMMMLIALAAVAGLALAPEAPPAPEVAAAVASPAARSAEQWLALVDRGDWRASYAATGAQFRALNTLEMWTSASLAVRGARGVAQERVVAGDRYAPAPPQGYRIVTFNTRFAQGPAVETVSLAQEGDGWRVVGYLIE